jgi:hypothetical protein
MPTFYSNEPELLFTPTRSHVSATRMRVLPIERRKKSPVIGYFLDHPYRAYIIAFAVAIALSVSTAWADMPEAHQQGDVTYISGGIGSDETDALAMVKKDYNLYLTSTDSTGHFLGGARITISNAKREMLVDVVAQGPLFYAHLPNGRYAIESFNGTQSKKQSVTITNGKAARVHFTWPVSAADSAVTAHNTVEPTIISPDPITVP